MPLMHLQREKLRFPELPRLGNARHCLAAGLQLQSVVCMLRVGSLHCRSGGPCRASVCTWDKLKKIIMKNSLNLVFYFYAIYVSFSMFLSFYIIVEKGRIKTINRNVKGFLWES